MLNDKTEGTNEAGNGRMEEERKSRKKNWLLYLQ
jgi:hypothetical protein